MYYGVSYYLEHKEKEDLAKDLKMLIASGINTVRMGEFAWCRMEPREGDYQFDWLKEVVEILGKAGIRTIICTPTACPPAWLTYQYPEILYMDNRGETRPFGGRRFYCYNSPIYRKYSEKIATALTNVFGKNPYVMGFQIDNEPAQEASGRCHCSFCQKKFTKWLEKKYHSIDNYNKRSGTIFWGQEYDSFEQIKLPVNTIEVNAEQTLPAYFENPTLRLEFERFSSESQIEYQNIQAEALRGNTNYPVTTNGTGLETNSIDYYQSTKNLDCYGFDYYPSLRDAQVDSFPYAFARGVKEDVPFWVMEFMSGGGHRFGGSGRMQPNPEALKQAVLQSFAHGAEMMLHFQYRTFPFGAEQLNYAIVDMDGVARRRYYEMQETAALLKRLEVLERAKFDNQIAICLDYDVHWVLRIKPVNDSDFHYLNYARRIYQILLENGYNVDVISYQADFSKYKMIVLPTAIIADEALQNKTKAFVSGGGTLLATFLSFVKNKDNVGYTESLPAGVRDVFGVEVQEVEPIFDVNHNQIEVVLEGESLQSRDGLWCDIIAGKAHAIGKYLTDYKEGEMIVSENHYGDGFAYYLGTDLEAEVFGKVLGHLAKRVNISKNPFHMPKKVEIVRRVLEDTEYYFVFNFMAVATTIETMVPMRDYLEDCDCGMKMSLERNGFRVLTKQI